MVRAGDSEGKGWEKTLWTADDGALKADGEKVLNFWQAKAEVLKLAGKKSDGGATTSEPGAPVTLDETLKQYETKLQLRGGRLYNAKRPRDR